MGAKLLPMKLRYAPPTLLALSLVLAFTTAAPARPRPPAPPWPEISLSRWSFDEPLAVGTNLSPTQLAGLHRAESWSGYALVRAGVSAPPVWRPAVGDSGRVQVVPEAGAVRFWFRPDWTSGEDLSGAGFPRLLELARLTPAGAETAWSLQLDADGGRLSLTRVAGSAAVDVLSTPITWTAGEWRLVALEWSATATGLYLDGELAALGGGLPLPTGFAAASAGLVLGSDTLGGNLAQGQFEEVTSFRRLEAERLPHYQAGYAWLAALGPITPEEDAARASATLDGSGLAPMSFGPGDPCPTNGPVYMTNLWCGFATNTGWTMRFDVAGGTNNVLYDVFTTAALRGTNVAEAQWYQVEDTFTCATVVLTNQFTNGACYILGLTNDTDAGGLSDAFEALVTGGDIEDADDDLLTPVVRIEVTDSVAVEQQATNTARFRLTRQGGFLKQPLTVTLLASGTATNGSDYTLSGAIATTSNLLMTFNPREMSVDIVLTAEDDAVSEGTETATLTLTTNAALWTLEPPRHTATAWLLEEYTKTYTTTNDFKLGVMAGLETVLGAGDGQLQFQTNLPPQFPFINVACSGRGTVARINTTNGAVLGEYRTTPTGLLYDGDSGAGPQPSRTTVDQYGNVWVANRADTRTNSGVTYGSITRIGLILGQRFSPTSTGFEPNEDGEYVSVTNATYNTCIDRDGDGFIRTSRGLADILPWTNPDHADSEGGVSSAADEAITEYTRVACTGTRTIAVDRFNDIWVGGTGNLLHLKVSGLTGLPVPNSAFAPETGGYGGVIDRNGNLWSSSKENDVLWLVSPATLPPGSNDWQRINPSGVAYPYGIAVDPLHPFIWQTSFASVFRWHTNGQVIADGSGLAITHYYGRTPGENDGETAQGLCLTTNGHVWVAHGRYTTTVGHLDTNGLWLGNVHLRLAGLRAEYYVNPNADGTPVLVRADAPINFNWGTNAPDPILPADFFSVRWSGVMTAPAEGSRVLQVRADPGAEVRLRINGSVVLSNWDDPGTNAVEMSDEVWLNTEDNLIELDYKEATGEARITLSWGEPGTTNRVPVPADRLLGAAVGVMPTGVSVDSFGKVWVACKDTDNAMRIDPAAGSVGEVDLVVPLGGGSNSTFNPHTPPYDVAAAPYNYSDMTGFNTRIVNSSSQPLKGYWTVIEDSGNAGQWWQAVSWSNNLPLAGCAMEVFVRASDERTELSLTDFIPASNGATLTGVKGRFIEVRVALVRDDPSKHPVLYDLTLHGSSSGFVGDFLNGGWPYETQDWPFVTDVFGPEPMTFGWYVMYPWSHEWELRSWETNGIMVWTNADSWENGTWIGLSVSNAAGETLWLGPRVLEVYPLSFRLPATNHLAGSGPAERYPATIHVRGEPTNGLARVEVTLHNLRHAYPADLDILLVSPSGTNIMLMSDTGGSFAVADGTLVFHPWWQSGWPYFYPLPPEQGSIPSNTTSDYVTANYGEQEAQLPGAPAGSYLIDLDELRFTDSNPNGIWKLYIYDDKSVHTGVLQESWSLRFYYNP
jgi:hypothetical protein